MISFRRFLVSFVVVFVGLCGFFSIPGEILAYIMLFLATTTVSILLICLGDWVYKCLYGEEV